MQEEGNIFELIKEETYYEDLWLEKKEMEEKQMKKFLIAIVHGYQRFISPLFPPSCRYHPTCSNYMIQAIKVHGAFKGTLMGIARILRCHPFVKGGVDYVPLTFSLKRNTKDQHHPNYKD